jgi:hypothetical protein
MPAKAPPKGRAPPPKKLTAAEQRELKARQVSPPTESTLPPSSKACGPASCRDHEALNLTISVQKSKRASASM